MSATAMLETLRPPTVCFIDDSATMREVMKIAFRRENIEVVACQNATAALMQIEKTPPDVVITDVIMPDKDGFEVCQFIKQHPRLNKTPVVLLSGVVNREVADKAFQVNADELIRKPFQPNDLIARVKQLLAPKNSAPVVPPPPVIASEAAANGGALSGIFGNGPLPTRPPAASATPLPAPVPPRSAIPAPVEPAISRNVSAGTAKLRFDVARLETLVKKLQSELAAEREYSRALEAHVKNLQETEDTAIGR